MRGILCEILEKHIVFSLIKLQANRRYKNNFKRRCLIVLSLSKLKILTKSLLKLLLWTDDHLQLLKKDF